MQKFQALLSPDLDKPIIRLNEECKIVARVALTRPMTIKNGDPVAQADIQSIEWLGLTQEEEEQYGHISALRFGTAWSLAWDARYNKGTARNHFRAAKEFFRHALDAYRKKRLRAFADNLYSAFELLAKADLLLLPIKGFGAKTKHAGVKSRFNSWVKIGNAPTDAAWALNFLEQKRRDARYLHKPVALSEAEIKRLTSAGWSMLRHVQRRLRKLS